MERFRLAEDYEISRILRGGWQLAGGHGEVDKATAIDDLVATADAGITTFDCADIYTGVEEIIGAFRHAYQERRGAEALAAIRVHTKFVPDLDLLPVIRKADVEAVIDRSMKRLGMERLDLVQFHWWAYDIPGCLDVAGWLVELQKAGKINRLAGTNFNSDHVKSLVENGYPLTSMQVQYSLLDRRPQKAMAALAAEHGFHFLCYGTVAGGFLSDRWLGAAEPVDAQANRSLTKYKLIIDEFGGWDLFQALLGALRGSADRHGTDIATVASRYVLGLPHVAGVIVGARDRSHLGANLAITGVNLTDEDRGEIEAVLSQGSDVPGDVYDVERDRTGPHGSIMKYNLSRKSA